MDAFITWASPILVALIGGIFSYLGVSRTVKASHDKNMLEIKLAQEKQILTIENQIEGIKKDLHRLEEKQDKHNAVIERTYKLEQQVADLEKRMGSDLL